MSEENMHKVKKIIEEYGWWYKTVGINGLCSLSKLSLKTINSIKYRDVDTVSNEDIAKLIKGLTRIKNKTIKTLDEFITRLEELIC